MHLRTILYLKASLFAFAFFFTPALAEENHETLPHRHLSETTAELITRLQDGGYVLVTRHERTNAFIPDSHDVELENCATQRNLSVAGYATAVENGAILRHLQIPIGHVFASPACRTLETARLMFGTVSPEIKLLGYGQAQDAVRSALTELVKDGSGRSGNTALVTHLGTYAATFGGYLAEGDTAIFDVVNGLPVLLGVIAGNVWNDAIIDASHTARAGEDDTHDHD